MMRFIPFATVSLLFTCGSVLHGQAVSAAQAPSTLSVAARLVNLPVVVRDKKGALVQNLTKDSFVLTVDGAPQTIRYFDHDADLPLILGLLVDTSMSQRSVLDQERTASVAFLDDMLKSKADQAFVIQFARSTELLADLTNSRPQLQAGLKDIDSSSGADPVDAGNGSGSNGSGNDPDSGNGRSHRGYGGGGTVLFDATFLASDELMSKQKGRKALILLTDGGDRGSRETISKAIEATQRADTTIYAIYYKGTESHDNGYGRQHGGGGFPGGRGGGGYPGGRGGSGQGGGGNQGGGPGGGGGRESVDGKKILERMCGETGGRLFEVKGKQDVAAIYREIGEELRAQYRLGYTPDAAHAEAGYHQVDLTLRDSKAKDTIQTRDGYYSGKP